MVRQPANAAELTAIQNLSQKLNIKRTSNSYVIEAEVASEDPAKSARLTRAIADAFLADQSESKAGDAKQANTMLDSRLVELRVQVQQADTAVEAFRSKNGLLLATGSLVNEQQLSQVNAGLVQAQAATAEARARYERMQRLVQSGGLPDTVERVVQLRGHPALARPVFGGRSTRGRPRWPAAGRAIPNCSKRARGWVHCVGN